ncbi:hypothetical protein C6P45_005305 [Maudiozyma exigua]|uniref:Hyphally-regulated cell wall protein N-terminal domain-containing protein n=1 Tax=Maudiozyma exigua TaxID=34358 RepID=A0A9P6WEW0_MAUEX|nr:hypothetical protein C6P45_005305 [Kazachstania exigua]
MVSVKLSTYLAVALTAMKSASALTVSEGTIMHNSLPSEDTTIESTGYVGLIYGNQQAITNNINIDNGGALYVGDQDANDNGLQTSFSGTTFSNQGVSVVDNRNVSKAMTVNWDGTTIQNSGKMFFEGPNVDSNTFNVQPSSELTNNGLMVFSQDSSSNYASSVNLKSSKFTNDGTICMNNVKGYLLSNVDGSGCITVGSNTVYAIQSTSSGTLGSQTLYMTDSSSIIYVDSKGKTDNIKVAGFGNGNFLSFGTSITGWSYDSSSGVLTVNVFIFITHKFNIGTGYDSSKFKDKQINNHIGTKLANNALYYDAVPPSSDRPSVCAVCETAPWIPIPPPVTSSSVSSTPTSSIISATSSSVAPSTSSSVLASSSLIMSSLSIPVSSSSVTSSSVEPSSSINAVPLSVSASLPAVDSTTSASSSSESTISSSTVATVSSSSVPVSSSTVSYDVDAKSSTRSPSSSAVPSSSSSEIASSSVAPSTSSVASSSSVQISSSAVASAVDPVDISTTSSSITSSRPASTRSAAIDAYVMNSTTVLIASETNLITTSIVNGITLTQYTTDCPVTDDNGSVSTSKATVAANDKSTVTIPEASTTAYGTVTDIVSCYPTFNSNNELVVASATHKVAAVVVQTVTETEIDQPTSVISKTNKQSNAIATASATSVGAKSADAVASTKQTTGVEIVTKIVAPSDIETSVEVVTKTVVPDETTTTSTNTNVVTIASTTAANANVNANQAASNGKTTTIAAGKQNPTTTTVEMIQQTSGSYQTVSTRSINEFSANNGQVLGTSFGLGSLAYLLFFVL